MPIQLYADVISNKKITSGIYKMVFITPLISEVALPGQFVHVRCSSDCRVFLRRPFSIQHVSGSGEVSIVYKVVGKGTFCLSEFKEKDKIDIIGPLGNNFSIPKTPRKVFIVAGGMGIAPLSFLIDFIVAKKVKILDNIEVIFGAKSKKELVLKEDLNYRRVNFHPATDDGSLGAKGTAVGLFKDLVQKYKKSSCLVYAGGPTGMFKELNRVCSSYSIPAQVICENNMGCGLGVCLGCVIETKSGFKRVCKDGPVFDIDQIKW